jgi:hemerythrin-like domain-containing protein
MGILMNEHQLILRMIAAMRSTMEAVSHGDELDPVFVDTVVDFIRTYADHCHHGKEEDILFRDLAGKPMTAEDAEAMQALVDDHVWARAKTRELVAASERYFSGEADALAEVTSAALELADFYPGHIEREDSGFFRRANGYFTADERDAMSAECREYDRLLIHETYRRVVEGVEAPPTGR